MNWKQQNGIFVPETPLQPIRLFVDETFSQDRSCFLQAGFPVLSNIYDSMIVPRCRELLAKLGPDAREFKGSAIKRGNVGPYRDFVRLFTSVSTHIADHAPLFPVVSLEGMASYESQQFESVRFNVAGALQNLNASNVDYIVSEFSRQILWLHCHLLTVAPQSFRNDWVFTFDAKYLHAEQTRENRFFSGGRLGVATMSSLESVLSSCARTLLNDSRSVMRLPTIGRVARFRVLRSSDEFGLQAADVLCHLVYSALRQAVGIVDGNTEFKVNLLKEFMPEFTIDEDLRSKLEVVTGKDGRRDLGLTDASLRSRFQIAPGECK